MSPGPGSGDEGAASLGSSGKVAAGLGSGEKDGAGLGSSGRGAAVDLVEKVHTDSSECGTWSHRLK